jgi:hypothetical protein
MVLRLRALRRARAPADGRAAEFGISELAESTRVEEDSMDTVRALKQVIMFKELSEPVVEIVAGTAEEVSVPAGEEIISVRDTPDAFRKWPRRWPATPKQAINSIARSPGPSHAICAGRRA